MRLVTVFVKDWHQPLRPPSRENAALVRRRTFAERRKRICAPEFRKVQTTSLGCLRHVAHGRIVGRGSNQDQRVPPEEVRNKTRGPAGAQTSVTTLFTNTMFAANRPTAVARSTRAKPLWNAESSLRLQMESPRAIALRLDAEYIAGPHGKSWGPSTIYGNWGRGTGILNNELYIGKLVWNRQKVVKDPATGKRQVRPNPCDEWINTGRSRPARY